MPEFGGQKLSLLHAPPAPGHRQDEGSCRQCPGAAQPRDDVLPRSYLQILLSLCGANSQLFNNRLKGLLNLFRLVEWYCVDISTLLCISYNPPPRPITSVISHMVLIVMRHTVMLSWRVKLKHKAKLTICFIGQCHVPYVSICDKRDKRITMGLILDNGC